MAVYKSEDDEVLETWSAGLLLSNDTVFQTKGIGSVSFCSGAVAPTDPEDGTICKTHDSIRFAAGQTVYWRRVSNSATHFSTNEVSA